LGDIAVSDNSIAIIFAALVSAVNVVIVAIIQAYSKKSETGYAQKTIELPGGVKLPKRFIRPIIGWTAIAAVVGFVLGYLAVSVFFSSRSTSPQSIDDKILPIESVPLFASAYGGEGDENVKKGSSRLSIAYDGTSTPRYVLEYTLPSDGYGYAGLACGFSRSLDLEKYEFIQVTLQFNDKQTRCKFAIRDISLKANYVPVGIGVLPTTGVTTTSENNGLTYKIPLKENYKNIDLKAIDQVGVLCDTDLSQGSHSFTLSKIKFIQP
jgi:hypothetical protein